jgi:Protein of unknown function (DUF751)
MTTIFVMNDFWNNISRYPRFFISSVTGLILVMLSPFKNLLKVKKFRFILPIAFIFSIGIIYLILISMTGL